MKKYLISLLSTVLVLTIVMAGCSTTPDIQEIKDIPDDAVEIMTSELLGQSGTYTRGSVYVSGNGYIIFDVQLASGSADSIGIKDAAADEAIYTISKPQTALYDSTFYEYQANSEYELILVDAKDLTGTITVYFVAG